MSKSVLVVGQTGFLGGALHKHFGERAREQKERYDLTIPGNCMAVLQRNPADVVINAAGVVGGIEANRTRPAEFYLDNLLIGTHLLDAARQLEVKKYVQIGSVCSYPREAPMPMRESGFWNGLPEETNGAYGLAKRALIAQSLAYHKQYGMNIVNPILANLYGPGDHFEEYRSHVVAAMVRKFVEAVDHGDKFVELWGSGECTREFLYIDDAVEALAFIVDRHNNPEPINVATGFEITIKELAYIVGAAAGFKGKVRWDRSKPDGQPRRYFDTSKMAALGWESKMSLADGIYRTVAYYKKRRQLLHA